VIQLDDVRGIGRVVLSGEALNDGSVDPSDDIAYFDDLRVSAVPKPSSLVSAALGLACLAGYAGSRRRRAA
jgi:MYXO-CTERM domain-containing protein